MNLGILNSESLPAIPRSGITLLTQRPDIDMAVLAMTAALYVRRIMLHRKRGLSALGLLLSLVAVSGFSSRAGLLAVLTAMVVAYICTLAAHRNPDRKLNWVMMAPVMLAVAVFTMPQTEVGQRLLRPWA